MRDCGLRLIMLQPVIILSQLIAITLTVEAPNVPANSKLDNATSATGIPYFAKNEHSTTLRVQLGSTAQLHCQVFRVQEKTVSWSRRRGDTIHLLTVGFNTYYKDNRFSLHFEEPHDWKLQIRYVQQRDEGLYECQVSSHPPLIRNVTLQVVNPNMRIVDVRGVLLQEKFYQRGSTIELQCLVHDVPSVPTLHLAWYKGPDRLNYDTMRGGVSVKTDIRHETVTSWLRVNQAVPSDTGNYTCLLRNVVSASVIVHVLNDEYPAAMQHASNTSSAAPGRPCTTLTTTLGVVSIFTLHHVTHAQQVILPWILQVTSFLERFFYCL